MSKEMNIRKIMAKAGKETPKEYNPFLQMLIRDIDPEMYDRIDSGDINPFYNMINSKEDQARIINLMCSSGKELRKQDAEQRNKINNGQQEN